MAFPKLINPNLISLFLYHFLMYTKNQIPNYHQCANKIVDLDKMNMSHIILST